MEFDFIIVGAGSAGCVLANRLSADPKVSVALVEAGGRDLSPWIHIPVGYFRTIKNPALNWMYRTEPDPGLNGRSINWPRGKTLGGSSSINGLLYVRGQRQDYDGWRDLGNAGWGWDEVLPFFRRSETWEGGADAFRGGEGPLSVTRSRQTWRIVDAWLDAAVAAGHHTNPDYNGAEQEGVGHFQLTARHGLRCSAARAYLAPVRGRKNLRIFTHATTEKLLFSGRRAVGIAATRQGESFELKARGEVILSAGAIGSPQLLMLSGIGDPAELGRHGIEVLQASPGVGRNLQDHLQARPVYRCSLPTINTRARGLVNQMRIGLEYLLRQSGPLTMAASLGTAFLKTRPDLDRPDIQFHIQPFSADNPTRGTHEFDAFTASVLQLRPESCGHLALRSASIHDHPAIHPNYLATELDRRTLVDGIRIARRICRQDPVQGLITGEHAPGADIADGDDAALIDWARNTATTIYHPTGTCRMGSDPLAVVDARLRVHSIEGLRVVDASIMPRIVSGNTNAPAIMIGEKAADMIRGDAR
ncbi:choline dehydrogenase [Hoeflea marina]|uniref:Choline dehydrogenase n=1 Tax=Hoeflea marina TaxID=274592 RepID=A0A317PNC5_9HYPH|nr:choline dehydrogenase [Hoeflea marina]PWW00001.1 choline dehydrogenase [Hoeflea marina]